jgi:signal peptidase I
MRALLLGSNPRIAMIRAVALIASAAIVFGYVLVPMRLQGISMLPTYSDGAFNFANRLAYLWRPPARGDVVAIRMAGPSVMYVKRIVGLPRERVEIAMGVVMINGEPLVEPSVVNQSPWNLQAVTLGDEDYFVIGDNRAMEMQDHDFGRASRDRIIGKMLF